MFQTKFYILDNFYANHAHSDIIEFIGEFGIFGFVLLIISLLKFLFNLKIYNFINIILIVFSMVILAFDFSLHIPLIQLLFVCFYSLNDKLIKAN